MLLKIGVKKILAFIAGKVGAYGTSSLLLISLIHPIIAMFFNFWSERAMAKPLISEALCRGTITTFKWNGTGLFDYVGYAMAAGIAFSTIVFLIGRITGNKKLETFIKTEAIDLLITYGAIVVGIGLLYIPCMEWMKFGDIKLNMYESAFLLLQHVEVYSYIVLMFSLISGYVFFLVVGTTITNNVFGGLSLPAFVGISPIYKPIINNTVMAVSLGFITYSIQVLLYEVLTYGSIKYLLPLGIFMRAFTPTKKIGGAIIGFSLGVTLFYTIILAMGWDVLYPYMSYFDLRVTGEYPTIRDRPGYYAVDYETDFSGVDEQWFGTLLAVGGSSFEDLEKDLERINANQVRDRAGQLVIDDSGRSIDKSAEIPVKYTGERSADMGRWIIKYFVTICGGYFIILIVYPIIMIIFVVTGVRFMSKFFGVDIDISNLTRVI